MVAIGNVGERAFLDSLVTTATITGCAYDDILVHTECGPTVEQRAAHIHSFVDRFNIAVDDWSALSESERRDAVLHLLNIAGHKEQCRFLGVKPCLHYHLQIDEALGSTMGLSIIDASMHMLNDMKTFIEAEVSVAEDGAGKGRQAGKN